jgi:hypothetical protein
VSATRTRLVQARLLAARGDRGGALDAARAVEAEARAIGMAAVARLAAELVASVEAGPVPST